MDGIDEECKDSKAKREITDLHQELQAYGQHWLESNSVQFQKKPNEEPEHKRKIDEIDIKTFKHVGTRIIRSQGLQDENTEQN